MLATRWVWFSATLATIGAGPFAGASDALRVGKIFTTDARQWILHDGVVLVRGGKTAGVGRASELAAVPLAVACDLEDADFALWSGDSSRDSSRDFSMVGSTEGGSTR